MITTAKNYNYHHEVFIAPCYLMREKLQEDYQHFLDFGLNTADIIALFADHLTAYNELVGSPYFWKMRNFNVDG